MAKASRKKADPNTDGGKARKYVSQSDVPSTSLDDALRVAAAVEEFGGDPQAPLSVASALGISPQSSDFRTLCGAAIAYGLTDGGCKSKAIGVTSVAQRILRPTEEGQDSEAKREAFLKPRVVGEFVRKYDGRPFPRPEIALNVLERMGVPRERAKAALDLIESGAASLGLTQEIKGKWYIQVTGLPVSSSGSTTPSDLSDHEVEEADIEGDDDRKLDARLPDQADAQALKRVFITHGKNKAFVDPIKKLVAFGELQPVVSVEHTSVSKPVPDKVMDEMRTCGAAIIHVDAEETLIDSSANERKIINPNVLIEIGAAMALYGRRFILLVREGVELPSNLQGLYEVRYGEDNLDGAATIRLLEAISDIKNHPLPQRYGGPGGAAPKNQAA